MEIKKKEDEVWKNLESLEADKMARSEFKISKALMLKFGRTKNKAES